MLNVGFVGWRGMVGSVLMQRMQQQNDFSKIHPVFFSTSNSGGTAPIINGTNAILQDANDINVLLKLDCIVTTQGSKYTDRVLPLLKQAGFKGYWIDASSTLRMSSESTIVLDPINRHVIDKAIYDGIKVFCGGNCTVSLMMMAVHGLLDNNLIEWISSMTYQSASGAGANSMKELLKQSGYLYNNVSELLADKNQDILALDSHVSEVLRSSNLPRENFGASLVGNLIPWVDVGLENGQTKEEWKGGAETNKILGLAHEDIKVDGLCVRVGSMRCHSEALTIKLKRKDLSLSEIEQIIASANEWVKVIPNTKEDTLRYLTPVAVSGKLDIAVGRIRRLSFGEDYITLFTVGDQLLWGAAEPLRRMLQIIVAYHE